MRSTGMRALRTLTAHLVPAMCRAAVAVGADGVILECHPDPEHAASDGAQSIVPRA